jgi:hypothetical protein
LDDAAAKGAVCIDGSPAAYYIRTTNAVGVKADPTKWVVFMEGGGWASSLAGTVDRAKTDLGSSKNYPVVPTRMEGTGMFATDPFSTHTVVYTKYCDGGSFTGAMSNPPVHYLNSTFYFRGRGIFDGLFDDLFENRGLGEAKELLYSGCSAGGLTAYIHADSLAAMMKARAPAAKVVVVADAMYVACRTLGLVLLRAMNLPSAGTHPMGVWGFDPPPPPPPHMCSAAVFSSLC